MKRKSEGAGSERAGQRMVGSHVPRDRAQGLTVPKRPISTPPVNLERAEDSAAHELGRQALVQASLTLRSLPPDDALQSLADLVDALIACSVAAPAASRNWAELDRAFQAAVQRLRWFDASDAIRGMAPGTAKGRAIRKRLTGRLARLLDGDPAAATPALIREALVGLATTDTEIAILLRVAPLAAAPPAAWSAAISSALQSAESERRRTGSMPTSESLAHGVIDAVLACSSGG
jgi:hypothetical protein